MRSKTLHEEFGFLSTYGGRTNFPVIHDNLVIISGVIIGWGDMAQPAYRVLAFDKRNGKLLWEAALPFSADATPITYRVDGRQYVVIFASGGKERAGSGGGVYVAFALPKS